jgi:uncharacterized protein (TIGR03000 family)
MYSAVLMLALTAGSETADFGRNRCAGACNGGYGYGCSSGVVVGGGYGCSGSYGYGCSGSYGCSSSHGHGGLFGGRRGGCSGGGLFGGGLFGGHHRGGCSGSYGCSSGYYGCSGGGYACSGGVVYGSGAPVCCGGGTVVVPQGKDMPKSEPIPEPKKKTTQSSAPATIIVSLPADARLFIDGNATTSTSARRTLVTPELAFGTTYVYTMRAEVVRDGQVQSQSQQVNVIGGAVANVQFNLSSQGVASR